MPMFEYRCKSCGHVTTFLEPAGDAGTHACEACDSTDTEKMLSTFSAQAGGSTGAGECPTCTGPSCPDAACRTGSCPF